MTKILLICLTLAVSVNCFAQGTIDNGDTTIQKTIFQTGSYWMPEIDIRSDAAVVYGVHGNPSNGPRESNFEKRLKSWQNNGYQTDFMTGIAWGSYRDYFYGKWDGKRHLNEAQVALHNDTVWHGNGIPYIVPSESYLNYFKKAIVRKVIDAGVTRLFFEEPEFWARSGYSDAFKTAWKKYYGFSWRPQEESAENTYLSNKLKYHLYYNALKEVSSYAKSYGQSKGLEVKVFIPTHSLVNYSSWKIVSPEASLASLPGIDGYIAQVWTGTSRTPVYFNGIEKERTFENAFLEYGSMVSMTKPTGRMMYFLTDPIEDARHDWGDYKRHYEATFTAEMLYPMVDHFEVMPWPKRIFTQPYLLPDSDSGVLIPKDYSTQILVMINALNKMPLSSNQVSGTHGIGVLMGNSLMFQRFPTHDGYEDPLFSNFYGQTLPLLLRGAPIETVHLENLSFPGTLKDIKVLVMSYSNMKPMSAKAHLYLSDWVKEGGFLVYCGRDDDPYQSVMEWWNTKGNHFKRPSDQLFRLLNIHPELRAEQVQKFSFGKGKVYVLRQDPKEFIMHQNGDTSFIQVIKEAYRKNTSGEKLIWKNNFMLRRGPYEIVAVMEESVSREPAVVGGPVIDLFDPQLPVLNKKVVKPGHQAFLYDLKTIKDKKQAQVLASAARIYNEKVTGRGYSFTCKGPLNTINNMRILLPEAPGNIKIMNQNHEPVQFLDKSWDENSRTLFLSINNQPAGAVVQIHW